MNLLLDTDALLWLSQGNSRLGPKSKTAIDQAAEQGSVRFSAVSMLEVTRLHWNGRIDLRTEPGLWYRGLLGVGVLEIPMTSEIAILAGSLKPRYGFHTDPADQLITATAISTGRTMLTSDRMILKWASGRTEIACWDARS